MKKPINAFQVSSSTDNPFPKVFHPKMGKANCRALGDHFDLSAFGVNMETIPPGSASGLKHWHTESEEFVYVITGSLRLYYGDQMSELKAGDCIGFRSNEGIGHRLVNNSDDDAIFMVIGSRNATDKAVYDEDDFQWLINAEGEWIASRKSGEPYE